MDSNSSGGFDLQNFFSSAPPIPPSQMPQPPAAFSASVHQEPPAVTYPVSAPPPSQGNNYPPFPYSSAHPAYHSYIQYMQNMGQTPPPLPSGPPPPLQSSQPANVIFSQMNSGNEVRHANDGANLLSLLNGKSSDAVNVSRTPSTAADASSSLTLLGNGSSGGQLLEGLGSSQPQQMGSMQQSSDGGGIAVANASEGAPPPPHLASQPTAPPVLLSQSLSPTAFALAPNKGKKPLGRPLSGSHVIYDINERRAGESQPQLEVSPITVYGSEFILSLGSHIAVNRSYIGYGLRQGHIRVLNCNTATRTLLRGHTTRLSDMAFFAEDVHLLITASIDGRVLIRQIEEREEEANVQIQERVLWAVQFTGPWEVANPRVMWHPLQQDCVVVSCSRFVFVIEIHRTAASSAPKADGEGFVECNCEDPVEGVQVLKGHTDQVTDLAIPPGIATRLASSSLDGTVRIWNFQGACLSVITPYGGAPVNAVAFLSSPVLRNDCVLLTGGPLNREIKLWLSRGREASVPAAAGSESGGGSNNGDNGGTSSEWQCLQTVEMTSSNGNLEADFFNQVTVVQNASLVLIANSKKNAIYALHVDFGNTPGQAHFDYLAEFTVAYPILSFTAAGEAVEPEAREGIVQIFCVQTQAIQQYSLDITQCLRPKSESVEILYLDAAGREATESFNGAGRDASYDGVTVTDGSSISQEPNVGQPPWEFKRAEGDRPYSPPMISFQEPSSAPAASEQSVSTQPTQDGSGGTGSSAEGMLPLVAAIAAYSKGLEAAPASEVEPSAPPLPGSLSRWPTSVPTNSGSASGSEGVPGVTRSLSDTSWDAPEGGLRAGSGGSGAAGTALHLITPSELLGQAHVPSQDVTERNKAPVTSMLKMAALLPAQPPGGVREGHEEGLVEPGGSRLEETQESGFQLHSASEDSCLSSTVEPSGDAQVGQERGGGGTKSEAWSLDSKAVGEAVVSAAGGSESGRDAVRDSGKGKGYREGLDPLEVAEGRVVVTGGEYSLLMRKTNKVPVGRGEGTTEDVVSEGSSGVGIASREVFGGREGAGVGAGDALVPGSATSGGGQTVVPAGGAVPAVAGGVAKVRKNKNKAGGVATTASGPLPNLSAVGGVRSAGFGMGTVSAGLGAHPGMSALDATSSSVETRGAMGVAEQADRDALAPATAAFMGMESSDTLSEARAPGLGATGQVGLAAQVSNLQEMVLQLLSLQRDLQQQLPVAVNVSVAKEGKRTEAAVGQRLDKVIKAHTDVMWARIQEELAKRDEAERERVAAVSSSLLKAVGKDLPAAIERSLRKELAAIGPAVAKALQPGMEVAVRTAMTDDAMQKIVADKILPSLEKTVAGRLDFLLSRQGPVVAGVKQSLQESVRGVFQSALVPAVEVSCRAMFEQMDGTFRQGLAEHMAQLQTHVLTKPGGLATVLQDSVSSLNALHSSMRDEVGDGHRRLLALADSVAQQSAAAVAAAASASAGRPASAAPGKRGGGSGGGSAFDLGAGSSSNSLSVAGIPSDRLFSLEHVEQILDPTIELSRLVGERKYEEAFTRALSLSDVAIVSWLCQQVDPMAVFGVSPTPLSQGVLLSLIQQLGCDLSSDLAGKLAWIREAVLALNPADPVVVPHMRPIFEGVHTQVYRQAAQAAPGSELSASIRLVMRLLTIHRDAK